MQDADGEAVVVRRLHDMDFRGWWALVALVPVIPAVPLGIVALLAWARRRGTPGPNRFGRAVGTENLIGTATPLSQPTPAASRDPVAEIERLAKLEVAGALTEAESATLKARALVWVLYATLRPFQVGGPGSLITLGTAPGNPAPDAATSAPPVDAAREIERLSRLREAGHLSEGEFASLKAGVLGRR